MRVSLDGEDDGEVEGGHSTNIRFGEQTKNVRGDERQRRRVSAPI